MLAPMTLPELLDAAARETQLRIGATGTAYDAMCTALAGDPAMVTAARQIIMDGSSLEQRDHITRWRSSLLRAALEA